MAKIQLKDMRVILGGALIITWVTVGVGGFLYHTKVVKVDKTKDAKIQQLNTSIQQIGELLTGYTVRETVDTGKEIMDTDLEPIQVPRSMATNLVLDKKELIGKHYKLRITKGTPLTKDLIYDIQLTDDLRLFDVVTNNNPVGLESGAYVDIRITLPMGEDFIAIPHKEVKEVNAGVLKLALTEHDIHVYNSMLVDSLLYPGTQIYAVEYLEGGIQKAADAYYPMSKNILAIAQRDPNLLSAIKADILQRRSVVDTGLTNVRPLNQDAVDKVLSKGKAKYSGVMVDAEKERNKKLEKMKEKQK